MVLASARSARTESNPQGRSPVAYGSGGMKRASSPALRGDITLVVGPMFSGKSTELLRRARRHTFGGRRVLLIKYRADTRYSVEKLSTHDKCMMDALPVKELAEVSEDMLLDYDVVGVDEGQFFPDVVPFAEKAANMGLRVIVAALDATFERKPFGTICELFPLAENITKLAAVCTKCGSDAAFTKRTTDNKEVEVIGGTEMYIPVCRSCFYEK